MFLLNGQPLPVDTPFTTPDGTQYPANWLRLASAEEKAAIGITEVAEAVRLDDRFWFDGNVDTPRDLDDCKVMLVSQIKQTAGTLLTATDWMVIRAAEGGTPLTEEVKAQRAAIRTASNDNEAAIAACTEVAELAALQPVWPQP